MKIKYHWAAFRVRAYFWIGNFICKYILEKIPDDNKYESIAHFVYKMYNYFMMKSCDLDMKYKIHYWEYD